MSGPLFLRFTEFKAQSGALTKVLFLGENGQLNKLPPNAGLGTAKEVKIPFTEFPAKIARLAKNQCLIHGVCGHDEIGISPSGTPQPGTIHRTKEYFSYPEGPGLGMLDHDPDGVGPYFTPDELVDAVASVYPPFRASARLVRNSTSSFVYGPDGKLLSTQTPGYHSYFVAEKATDLPRFGKVLFKRLWLAGYGHCRLSKSGTLLVRGPMDQAVFSPERCDFVAGAVLALGLTQKFPPDAFTPGNSLATEALPDLTDDEETEFQRLVAVDRAKLKPQQENVRRAYAGSESKRTGEKAEVVYKRLLEAESGTIRASVKLKVKSTGEIMSIGDMIAAGMHHAYIEDPTEYTDTSARLYIDGPGTACVRSFLHGGTRLDVCFDDELDDNGISPRRHKEGKVPQYIPPHFPAVTEPKAKALKKQRSVITEWAKTAKRGIALRRAYQLARTMEHARIDDDLNIDNAVSAKAVATKRLKAKFRKKACRHGSKNSRLAITGSQGSGKTSDAIREVAAMPDGIIWFLVPTLDKAEEARSDYDAMRADDSLPSTVMRGRSATYDPSTKTKMCARSELAEKVATVGLPVSPTLCRSEQGGSCPYFSKCPYQEQLRQLKTIRDSGRGVIFASHPYVFSTSVLPTPDAVIVDESIVLRATSVTGFAPDRITEVGKYWARTGADAGADYASLAPKVRNALASERPILKALRDAGITGDDLSAGSTFLEAIALKDLAGVGPSTSDEHIRIALDRLQGAEVTKVAALFRQLKREFEQPRDHANGVTFDPNIIVDVDGKKERQARVTVHSLRIPQFGHQDIIDQTPLLFLDGTGDIDLIRCVFGEEIKHRHIPMERWAEVTQVRGYFRADQLGKPVTMAFSRQSITGKDRYGISLGRNRERGAAKRLKEIAEIINGLPGDVFVGGSMQVMESFLNPLLTPSAKTAHFGAIRGLNLYEDCIAAVVVGREQPSAAAVENKARCFAGDAPEPFLSARGEDGNFEYVLQCRCRRLRDGTGQPEIVEVHPDPLGQAVLEQVREAEILQTIDRVRAIFNLRRIIILTSIVLDITVDRALSWTELKAIFALERQFPSVLLLTAGTAAGVLGSRRTAQRLIPSLIKTANAQIDSIWKVAVYRTGNQKRSSTVLFRADLANPQTAVEERLGVPLASFELRPGPDVAALVEPPSRPKTKQRGADIAADHTLVSATEEMPMDVAATKVIGFDIPPIGKEPLAIPPMATQTRILDLKNSQYDKKILFNVTQSDVDRMDETRERLGLDRSEFIRRAVRAYDAFQRVELYKKECEARAD